MQNIPHAASNGNLYTIYALIDPRNYTIRYIGITNDVYGRFIQHLRGDSSNLAKNAWIAELKQAQSMLIMKTLETVETVQQARERETFWIHHHRFLGASLLNQVIPSIQLPTQAVQTQLPRMSVRKPGNYGRKSNYDEVKEIIIHRHIHNVWPDKVSDDMRRKFEFSYFTKPKRTESSNPKRYAQHVKSYDRGRRWIAELALEGK